MIPIDLPIIWAFIIAFAVFVYVVMDGFDLGLGILFPLFPEKRDRDVIMNSVAPVWDGNETWLVLGGGGMMAAPPHPGEQGPSKDVPARAAGITPAAGAAAEGAAR